MTKVKVTLPSDREILITREFDAPLAVVFDCLSKPKLIRQWLLGPPGWSMPVCEIDLRVGGCFRYVWRNEDGREMGLGGTYQRIVRPTTIVQTERFEPDWTAGEALNTTDLTESAGITTMAVTVLYASRQSRDAAIGSGMTEGLDVGYDRLDALLASLQPAAR